MPGLPPLEAEDQAVEASAPLVDLGGPGPDLELEIPTPPDSDLITPAGLDLPAPADVDLPAPVDPGLDLPAPADVDLPAPVDVDLPAPADVDLPAPADIDLPAPADLDLPTPTDGRLDLPVPTDLDLPGPQTAPLPEPRGILPTPKAEDAAAHPADLASTPLDHLDLDLGGGTPPPAEPRTMIPDVQTAQGGVANLIAAEDVAEPAGAADAGSAAAKLKASIPTPDLAAARRSPAPIAPRRLPSPTVLGGVGVVLLAVLGTGAYYLGFLESNESDQAGLADNVDDAQVRRDASGPSQERHKKVLVKLAADTAKSYHQAVQMTEATADTVGQAEALLLMHLRYGPDPVLVGQAQALLEPHAAQGDEFVQRVVGLAALASNDLETAQATLVGDSPRVRLYRGWLRLVQENPQEAEKEATAVLAEHAEELGALHLQLVAQLNLGKEGALDNLRSAADANPSHPLLQQLLVQTLFKEGFLAEARERANRLDKMGMASKVHQARVLGLRGQIASASGERSEAILRFDQALELAPEDIETITRRLRALMKAREFSQVRSQLEVARREHPGLLEATLIEVELAIETGKGPKALEILATLQGREETDPRIPFLLGQVHAMRMAMDDAKAAFEMARARDPLFYEASIAEAKMLARAGRLEQALKVLDNAQTASAEAPTAAQIKSTLMLARARILVDADRREEAVPVLDQALEANGANNDARLLRGVLHADAGRRQEARSDLMALYERTRGYPGLTGPLGQIFMREGRLDELERLLGKQIEDPRAPQDVILVGAQLRLAQGKVDRARTLVERVLSQDSGNWEAHLVKTKILVADNDFETALVQIQQARPRTPQGEVELWKGKVLEYNGNADGALPHYAAAMELDPELLDAVFLHGRLLAYKGAAKQAAVELESVVEKTDEHPSAWLALGLAYRDLAKYDKAIRAFRKAAELDPTLTEANYNEGRLHNDRNQHAKTVRALNLAIKAAKANESWLPHAYRILGRAYTQLNRKSEARAAFEKYLEIAPPNAPGRTEVRRQLRNL
jgi:tetratricopeptide (TPR) repeat protein